MNNSAKKDRLDSDSLHRLDQGSEALYDLVMSGNDQDELPSDVLEIMDDEPRYEQKDDIASGGMKKISSAYDKLFRRPVAKAELKNKSRHEVISNFINEARIMARLEHPNIVPVYDLDANEEGAPFFTMKLSGGKNLEEIIELLNNKDPQISEYYTRDRLLEIFLKICDAVAYAHSKGILHLDIKPANIQVDQFGAVLLCDWGLAREMSQEENANLSDSELKYEVEQSLDGKIKGTPGFMAPEQVDPQNQKRSAETDIYGLGALLYNILTLRKPLTGASLDQVINNTLAGLFPSPLELNLTHPVPPGLNAVVMKAMALEAIDRYASAEKLAEDIRNYQQGFATRAQEAGFGTLISLMLKRYKKQFILGSIIFVSFIATILFFLVRLKHEQVLTNEALVLSTESEARLKTAHKQLQSSEAEARQLLFDLQEEKNERLALQQATFPQLRIMISRFQSKDDFKQARILSQLLYNLDPKDNSIILLAAYTSFGALDFSKANTLFSKLKNQEKYQWLIEFSQKYSVQQAPIAELHRLIQQLSRTPNHLRKNLNNNLLYSITQSYPLEDRFELAKKMLHDESLNHSHFDLQLIDGEYHLSLANNKTFGHIKPLHNLPLVSLDLSNTPCVDISPVENTPLKRLILNGSRVVEILKINTKTIQEVDVRNTQVSNVTFLKNSSIETLYLNKHWTDLKPLQSCENLTKLYLKDLLYSPKYIKNLGLNCEIIFY
ncbi:serine/threonine-protein kinase [Lentisphaera araneosa HTCC2155]|uniref:Serine/threonine-protein kinase n=1 Tax=Lentisphaera araneosa HTCC2155 TaxID=313628 RepID=A6DKL9_9BACT|nr:serine/threonine-protein kinase [Lentisphaera araneosa]EDM27917.1 serine/threonine-protein kinase [Lentisphaera araneosa HTCC2155]